MVKKLSEMNHDEIGDMMDAVNSLVRRWIPSDATFVLTVSTFGSRRTFTTTSMTMPDKAAIQRHVNSLEAE